MNTMKRTLAAALVLAVLGGGLAAARDEVKVRGCKPGIFPTSNEVAGDFWNPRRPHPQRPAVGAVRG